MLQIKPEGPLFWLNSHGDARFGLSRLRFNRRGWLISWRRNGTAGGCGSSTRVWLRDSFSFNLRAIALIFALHLRSRARILYRLLCIIDQFNREALDL